ncbi:capsule biosynthesis protein [Chitinophaga parva]|uniref:Capsule biosynthesis protein n=1 Tax=Chitinophaga parva TaxID=2169414 RepID=A0A2T7BKC8_9BACT|nr:SLBB domain-containing protein [Chitinophaga parva]PUZ28128.1 capsule biosynthesis protein [Chitinophaga parva]
MLKRILLIQLFLLGLLVANAQIQNITPAQASQVNVDNLSDSQIRQIVADMKQNGMTMDDINLYAQQKGVSQDEADKLKSRIMQLGLDKELTQAAKKTDASQTAPQTSDRRWSGDTSAIDLFGQKNSLRQNPKSRVFGADLFNNKNLTFEPNLRMATPLNYKLATDDQLLIDVYGYSETQYNLTVTTEGYIRIPNVGPIYVNGLTMSEAKARITKQLSTVYSTISSGQTSVQVALGNIRSIRVLMIGEIENPGSYTLPSLASVANALYVSGGPSENGSFRSIQVIRNGSVVTTFDLYDFLSRGDLTNNIVLQDQDIVKVDPYKTRVEITGQVKRPLIFEAKEGEVLANILEYAGGFTDKAYKENIIAYRNNKREKEVENIPFADIGSFKVMSGDQFVVDSILNRFSNRVTIAGAVFHPGDYGLEEGMTVGSLIKKADGVKEDASLNRGIIRRLQADYAPSIISFNVQDILAGKSDISLEKEDSVIIFNKFSLRQAYTVAINGQVNNPGTYTFSDSMHLEDLVLLAGGLTDAASTTRIEISRRIRRGNFDPADSAKALVFQEDVDPTMGNIAKQQFILQPFDEVEVRKSPVYSNQGIMMVEGEVVYPGSYTIVNKGEHVSDVIRRAGGIRPEGFTDGAVLLRKTFITDADSALLNNKLELFYSKVEDSTSAASVQKMLQRKYQLLGINLTDILKRPGSKYDILVEEGDVIKIPKKLQTVQLYGEVYFPKKIRFDNSSTLKDYIRGAGGYTSSALKRRSYVVYANGDVKATKKVLFFNRYPKIKPGAEIYVPAKKDKKNLSTQESIALVTGLATTALLIITLIDKLK